jgi:hypothetical protein
MWVQIAARATLLTMVLTLLFRQWHRPWDFLCKCWGNLIMYFRTNQFRSFRVHGCLHDAWYFVLMISNVELLLLTDVESVDMSFKEFLCVAGVQALV